jgi:glycosyltransferase involved in cell wall biosynthesis
MGNTEVLDVLFLSSWFPNRTNPTLGNFVERHAEVIARKHRVFIVHTVAVSNLLRAEITLETEAKLTRCTLYHPAGRPKQWVTRRYLRKALKHLTDHVTFSPDLVHLNIMNPLGPLAVEIAKGYDVPLVVTEHWTGYLSMANKKLTQLALSRSKRTAQFATTVCPVTDHLGRAMQQLGINASYETIGNVVDTELFHPKPSERDSSRLLLHVSSLDDAQKNVSGLIRGFAKAHTKRCDLRLKIIGEGVQEPYQRLVQTLGLPPGCVTFEGLSDSKTIARAMQSADAFVLFSNYETFSVVLAEAWACGLPAIYTRCGGLTQVTDERMGIVVEKGDENALAVAMIDAIEHPEQFDRAEMRSFVAERFSPPAIAEQFDRIYQLALKRSST